MLVVMPVSKGVIMLVYLANYRWISLLCILFKVLERIVHRQFSEIFDETNCLHEMQFGFWKGRSCSDLLLPTTDDWLLAKDNRQATAVAFIDLAKAFDNVNPQALLLKLQQAGFGGVALSWFTDYLKERYQRIVLYPSYSKSSVAIKGCYREVYWDQLFSTFI